MILTPNNTTGKQSVVGGNGAFGVYNITGGTLRDSAGTPGTGRFTVSNRGTGAVSFATNPTFANVRTGVVNVSGTGTIDQTNAEWWLNYSLGQINVTDSGTINRTGSTQPLGIIMDTPTAGSGYGVLNVAGANAQVITGATPIRFGNSTTAGNGDGNSGFVNLAAGTLSIGTVGTLSLPAAPNATNYVSYNYAGGTLRATATLAAGWSPATGTSATVSNTIFGSIDNSAVGGAPSFNGGLRVDTNGFDVTVPATSPLTGAGGTLTMANTNAITGAGKTLTVSGPGTVILAAAHNYTGSTTVSGGELVISGSISATSSISIAAG